MQAETSWSMFGQVWTWLMVEFSLFSSSSASSLAQILMEKLFCISCVATNHLWPLSIVCENKIYGQFILRSVFLQKHFFGGEKEKTDVKSLFG